MDQRKVIVVILTAIIFTASLIISYSVFSKLKPIQKAKSPSSQLVSKDDEKKPMFDASLPKTEPCPLNGALYSKEQRDWWEKHRPLGVMIDNHEAARPQSGLNNADVVYEVVAEGGITRFLAIYHCNDSEFVGPIRSARVYFMDLLSEYGEFPLYAHVGGAAREGPANALGQIEDLGWKNYNDLSQFGLSCPVYCQLLNRIGDGDIAIEHTMYSSPSKLWNVAKQKRKIADVDKEGNSWDEKFVPYEFKDDASLSERAESQKINLEFWEGYRQYAVDWGYDKKTNTYKRSTGGKTHVDRNTNEVVSSKNVVILYMSETFLNDVEKHVLYKTKGTGKAVVYMDGQKITATWRKNGREARTTLVDSKGKEIKFNRGKIWFEVLPTTGILKDS